MKSKPKEFVMNKFSRFAAVCAAFASLNIGSLIAGPKVTIIGDSYSTYSGAMPSGYETWYPHSGNDVSSADQTWWKLFIASVGGSLEVNNSWSGTRVTTGNTRPNQPPMIDDSRLNMLGNPDVILVFAGTNDAWDGAPLGAETYHDDIADYSNEEKAQFYPAFAYLIHSILERKPSATVFIIVNSTENGGTRPGIGANYAMAMENVAKHFGVKCVRLHDIEKSNEHPNVNGMSAICTQVRIAYGSVPDEDDVVSSAEYGAVAIGDDPALKVVRTAEGLAYVFTTANRQSALRAVSKVRVRRALVVGGGGAGGWTIGGGGGGGQVLQLNQDDLPNGGLLEAGDELAVFVGAGGGNAANPTWFKDGGESLRVNRGESGGTSVLAFGGTSFSALGGGGGASWGSVNGCDGANGGGGAGGWPNNNGSANVVGDGGSATVAGGYSGGVGYVRSSSSSDYAYNAAGGGGGAGGVGQSAVETCSGDGGAALGVDILGRLEYYGGGGGGGTGNSTVTPGRGGTNAGDGAPSTKQVRGQSAPAGFGGGGGGGGFTSNCDTAGGDGGSGTVVLLLSNEAVSELPVLIADCTARTATDATFSLNLVSVGEGALTANVSWSCAVEGEEFPPFVKLSSNVTAGWQSSLAVDGLDPDKSYVLKLKVENDSSKAADFVVNFLTLKDFIVSAIESGRSSDHYIDTGYVPTQKTRVELVVNVNAGQQGSWNCVFGTRRQSCCYNAFCFYARSDKSGIQPPVYNHVDIVDKYETSGTTIFPFGRKVRIVAEGLTATWYDVATDEQLGSITQETGPVMTGYNTIFLFNGNDAASSSRPTPNSAGIAMTLYSCKISERRDDGSYEVKRDFLPAVDRENMTVGIYDTVFGEYIAAVGTDFRTEKLLGGRKIESATLTGRRNLAVTFEKGHFPDETDCLYLLYGQTDGGSDPKAWDHVEVVADAVAADVTTLSVTLPSSVDCSHSFARVGFNVTKEPWQIFRAEYIVSGTSDHYLNTLYVPTQNTRVEAVVNVAAEQHGSWNCVFGTRDRYCGVSAFNFYARSNKSDISPPVYNHTKDETPGTTAFPFGRKVRIEAEGLTAAWYDAETGELLGSITQTGTVLTGSYPIYIFNGNDGVNPNTAGIAMTLYSFKISERQNDGSYKVKRDFVPVRLFSDGQIGLFDCQEGVCCPVVGSDFSLSPVTCPPSFSPLVDKKPGPGLVIFFM